MRRLQKLTDEIDALRVRVERLEKRQSGWRFVVCPICGDDVKIVKVDPDLFGVPRYHRACQNAECDYIDWTDLAATHK